MSGSLAQQQRSGALTFDRLDSLADGLIEALPTMDDDALWQTRRQARAAGKACWRIECAVDAEILSRITEAGRGRGKRDEGGTGRTAAVEARARENGVEPRQIWQNAQIYKTFFTGKENTVAGHSIFNPQESLEDKTFFEVALRAENPHEALRQFAERKAADPEFSTRDARRLIQAQPAEKADLGSVVEVALGGEDARAAWEAYQRAARGLSGHVPTVRGLVVGHLEEMAYELSRPRGTLKTRILELIEDGYNTAVLLAGMLGYHRLCVEALLQRLIDSEDVVSEKQVANEGARGAAVTIYRARKK